ncbi:MAG: GAF domain-containing protein [Chloroflexi bacterium]|nr:GAF domain-containing protein [Chloroflexota bacterium]
MATRIEESLTPLSDEAIRSLVEIGRALSDEPELSSAFERVVKAMAEVIDFDRLVISIVDLAKGTVVDANIAGSPIAERTPDDVRPLSGTVAQYFVDRTEPIVVNVETVQSALEKFPALQRIVDAGLESGISVPLRSRDDLVGVLHVRSYSVDEYSAADVAFTEAVSHQLAGPLASEQLRLRLVQSALEESVLAEISRILGSGLRVEDMFEQFGEQVKRLVPFQRMVIATADPASHTARDEYVTGLGRSGWIPGENVSLTGSLAEYMVHRRSPVYVFEGDESFVGKVPDDDHHRQSIGLASLISVPMIAQGELIGNLNVREKELSAYTLDDVRKMERVAAQIAGTLANQKLHDSISRQASEREVLAEIGRTINSTLRLEEVFEQFAVQARKLIPFDRIVISRVEAESDDLVDAYVSGRGVEGYSQGGRHELSSTTTSEVVRTGRSHMWAKAELERQAKELDPAARALESGLNSLLITPLVWQGGVVGTVNFRSELPDPYGPDEIRLAEEIGAQIAGAIATTRLYEESERESAIRKGLAEIGKIMTSSLDLNEVFPRCADQIARLIPFDRLAIILVDEDAGTKTDAYSVGIEIPGQEPGVVTPLANSFAEEILENGGPLLIGAAELADRAERFPGTRARVEHGLISLIAVPLLWRGRPMGILNIRSTQDDAYGSGDVELATLIAAQIAGSVATSTMYAESEREAEIRKGLAAIAVAAASDLRLDQMLEGVADELASVIPYDRMSVTLRDVDDPLQLRVAFIHGIEVPDYAVGDVVAINPDGEGQPWSWRSSFMTGLGSEERPGLLRRSGEELGRESWIEVPLGSPEEGPVGYLGLRSGESHEYSEADLEVLKRVAAQITPSISNSRLHEQLQAEARERELLAEIGRVIGDARNVSELFSQFKGLAQALIPSDGIAIATIDSRTQRFTIQEIHAPDRIEMIERGTELPLFPSMSGEAYEQRATIVYCPASAEEAGKRSPSLNRLYELGSRSFMACPLISRREILGTLLFQSSATDAYTEKHMQLADRLARQIAGKMESAQFQAQLQEEAKENELLAEVGRVISGSVDIGEMFAQFKGLARELLPIDGLGIALIDAETDTLVLAQVDTGGIDPSPPAPGEIRRRLQDSLARDAYATGKPVIYCPEDPDDIPADYPGLERLREIGARSFMAAPLISHGETLGALVLWARKPSAFSEDDARLAERLANQIAGKLEIANLVADVSKLAATVDASPDFISLSDPDFRLEYTNPAGLDLMGMLPLDETDAVRVPDLFTPSDARRLESEGLNQALRVGFWWAELEAMRSDGSTLPVEALLVPIKDSGGAVQSFSLQFRDISRRVAIQKALEESEEHYRDLFENAEELIQSADAEGNILYANRAWKRRLGYRSSEIRSMTIWDVIHPDGLEHCREVFAKIASGESVGEFDAEFVTKAGQKVFVRGTTTYRFEDGRPISTRGIFRDVGARLEVEKMKDEFVSMVSHELRTPLTSIRGSLGMLASGLLEDRPEQARRMLEIASANTDRLVRLINDILDIERIESRAIDMDLAAVDAREVIGQAAEEMQSFADERMVRLDARPGTAWVMADRDRIVQTLTNLISNAVKFSEPESTVTIDCHQEDERVLFTVSDSGRGIPPEKIDAIFERFKQADSSDSRDKGGTGLGLAICRLIVEQHGGQIYVESEMGAGSTFTFWLIRAPLSEVPAAGDVSGVAGELMAAPGEQA